MLNPISPLVNMEMALYGGANINSSAPSYLNGYRGAYDYNPYGMLGGYGNVGYNPTFGQSIPYNYGTGTQPQAQTSVFQGLSNAESQALLDDYAKSLTPSEGLVGNITGNAAFGLLMNPRLIAHPYNTIKSLGATNKAFASVKEAGSALNKLWVGTGEKAAETAAKNSNILREAWLQHNKALARCESKLGAFRRSYLATGDVEAIKKEVKLLEDALKAGNMEKITYQTAKLKHAYSANGGFLPRAWNTVKGWFGGSQPATVAEKLKDVNGINNVVAELGKTTKTGFKDILARGGGVAGGLFFMAIEFLMSIGKIKTAFEQDNATGMKQLGQTAVKGAGNAAGWAVGEAAAVWAFTKWGAKIGSKVHPLLGTLIGGAVGLIGGGLGMWLAGKATHAVVGQDVADKIEAKKLASTSEGQVQLLQNTMERIQKGEKVSPEAQMAIQKVAQLYA